MKKIILFLSLITSAFVFPQSMEEFSRSSLPDNSSDKWHGIRPSKNMEFFCVEDFESGIPWISHAGGAHEVISRFVKTFPGDKSLSQKKKEYLYSAYKDDWQLFNDSNEIHNRKKLPAPEKVYEVRSYIRKPGLDYLYLEAPHGVVYMDGSARMMTLYAHSRNYRHTAYGVFVKPGNNKIYVPLGDLNFDGWKRISVILPATIGYPDAHRSKAHVTAFAGIKIITHKMEPEGDLMIMLDLISFLVDKSMTHYSGSEIPDNWGRFRD